MCLNVKALFDLHSDKNTKFSTVIIDTEKPAFQMIVKHIKVCKLT